MHTVISHLNSQVVGMKTTNKIQKGMRRLSMHSIPWPTANKSNKGPRGFSVLLLVFLRAFGWRISICRCISICRRISVSRWNWCSAIAIIFVGPKWNVALILWISKSYYFWGKRNVHHVRPQPLDGGTSVTSSAETMVKGVGILI
jgi:hypothetical protein